METKLELPKVNVPKGALRKIIGWKLDALIIYLLIFVLGEVLISGGLYERGLTFGIVNSIFVLALALLWQYRRKVGTLMDQIYRGIIMAVVYAVLDFLIVDLLLEKFNHTIYKFWGTYAAYAIIFLVPIIYLLIPVCCKKFKANKVGKA